MTAYHACSNVGARSPMARYLNTNNFLRNIRNFKMDITRTDPTAYVCAIHWQVAQGTSLENIEFYMSQDAGTTQQVCPASNLVFHIGTDLIVGALHGKWKWGLHEQSNFCWRKLWVCATFQSTASISDRVLTVGPIVLISGTSNLPHSILCLSIAKLPSRSTGTGRGPCRML
jgi:hypothetical protein